MGMTGFYLKQACLENEVVFSTYSSDLVILGKGTHLAFVMCSFSSSSSDKIQTFSAATVVHEMGESQWTY